MLRSSLSKGSHLMTCCGVLPCWSKQTMACLQSSARAPTAGIIVIGDEILKGQVRDSNSHFIISRLFNVGVRVKKVSVISDDVNEISNEVRKFSSLYTYVITSGGIGPTHDDVTFEGVAKAFEEDIYPHPELVKICSEFYKTSDLTSPAMKLATVPRSAKLKYGFDPIQKCKAKYPSISVRNVYIFPGVPPLLEKSFSLLCADLFGGSGSKFHHSDLYVNESEVSIAEPLSMAVREFPSVAFGSYPQHNNSYYRIKLKVEANDEELLSKAVGRLKALLPPDCLMEFDSEPLESSYEKMEALGSHTTMKHLNTAVEDLLKALTSLRQENTAICLDSSLHSLVTLHLLHAINWKLLRTNPESAFIVKDNKSDKFDKFIQDTVNRYSLQVEGTYSDFNTMLSTVPSLFPNLKCVIAGGKVSSTNLQDKQYCDQGTVSVLTPVSLWTDNQVLEFLTKLNLPFMEV